METEFTQVCVSVERLPDPLICGSEINYVEFNLLDQTGR